MIRRLIKRVVVTGAATAPGTTVAKAFRRRGWLVVGVDAQFYPQHVNQFYVVSRGDQPGFVDELLMLVRRERATLVVPTREAEWVPLVRRAPELRRSGSAIFLPDPATVEDLADARYLASLLRRMGVAASDQVALPVSGPQVGQWFEASVCRDGRVPYESFACGVHELFADEHGSVRAERRKGEAEVEDIAARTAQLLNLPGPATVHIIRDADGHLSVARVTLSPCEYGPLIDDVLDALLGLWEREQPL